MMKKSALTMTMFLCAMSHAATKKVLIEESTDVDCGPCAGGAFYLDTVLKATVGKTVPIAFHYDDAMSGPVPYGYMFFWKKGYPNFTLDRSAALGLSDFQTDSTKRFSAMVDSVNAHIAQSSPVAITITPTWDSVTRTISGTVKAVFDKATTGSDMRIGLLVIQDSVIGPNTATVTANTAGGIGARYMQKNYYSDSMWYTAAWNNGVLQAGSVKYPNGMLSPEPILAPMKAVVWPVMGYTHRHVFRASLLGQTDSVWGQAGIIPNTVASGASYSAPFTYSLPQTYPGYNGMAIGGYDSTNAVPVRASQIHLIAFVSSAGQKTVLNVEEALLIGGNANTTSILSQNNANQIGQDFIAKCPGELFVRNLKGELVQHQVMNSGTSFNHQDLHPGTYFLQFIAADPKLNQSLSFIQE